MKAYFFVFALTFLISCLFPSKTEVQYRWKLLFTFLPLFVFGAIRVDFGLDYPAYERVFDYIHDTPVFKVNNNTHIEIGYQWLNYILPSFRSLLILNAFLLSFALGVFCYHNVPRYYLWLAVILIFLNPEKNIYGSLVGIRNGLVVTCFLLGFALVPKRKLWHFVGLIVILSTIHRSSVLFLPVAYIIARNSPLTRKEIRGWIIGFVLLVGLGISGLADILEFIVSNDYLDRYQGYVKKGVASGIMMVSSSLVLLIAFLTYLFHHRNSLLEKDNSLIRMGMLYLITNVMGSLAARASYFYDMFFIAAVVKIVSDKRVDISLRVTLALFAIAISCYSMFIVWMSKSSFPHKIYYSLWGSW